MKIGECVKNLKHTTDKGFIYSIEYYKSFKEFNTVINFYDPIQQEYYRYWENDLVYYEPTQAELLEYMVWKMKQ